jgi:hypothetical protein
MHRPRRRKSRVTCLLLVVSLLVSSAQAGQQSPLASSVETRADQEQFLATATVVSEPPPDGRPSWRATLEDGGRKHDASVETADGSDPTRRNYKFNVAAYELDKLLGLGLVPTVVERSMGNRRAAVTWWVDDFVMNELDRRRKKTVPPDSESWNRQVQAVRIFDELISNTYRDTSPPLYLNSVWDNLLITKDWTIWITDHTGAFRVRKELQDVDSLIRCPRLVLSRLRKLDRQGLDQALRRYLSGEQLDTLDVRRAALVKHFDGQIAQRGEAAVLYNLATRR